MHAFKPSTLEVEAGKISEFKVSLVLVYRVSSMTARVTKRNLPQPTPKSPKPEWNNSGLRHERDLRVMCSRCQRYCPK